MDKWLDLARIAAAQTGVPVDLILAIVEVESGGNQWAWNPEPHYRWFWDVRRNRPFRQLFPGESDSEYPPQDFPCLAGDRDQEWWGQQASWGLMQTMGAVARENGFTGPFLTELCDPATSLKFGTRHLHRLMQRIPTVDGVISAYNTGSPQHPPGSAGAAYVAKVRLIYRS